MEDKSRLMINATAPEGTSYEAHAMTIWTNSIAVVDTLPEKDVIMSHDRSGFGGGGSQQRFCPDQPGASRRAQTEPAGDCRRPDQRTCEDYTFARTYVTQEQTIGGGRGRGLPVQYVIQAPIV